MNKNEEILEIIDGFKNLTSKIKEDNDAIKNALKNKDLTINACKKEYRKLYAEHEELKKKYAELETRIKQNEVEKVKIERKRKITKAWVTKGSSIVSTNEYIHNETAQELPSRSDYFTNSDERVYIDLRQGKGFTGEFERVNRDDSELSVVIDLKNAAADKMRIYVTGYYQAEYIYMLTKNGLIMNQRI